MLTREKILNAKDLPFERIHITEWGGDVYIRGARVGDAELLQNFPKMTDCKVAVQVQCFMLLSNLFESMR